MGSEAPTRSTLRSRLGSMTVSLPSVFPVPVRLLPLELEESGGHYYPFAGGRIVSQRTHQRRVHARPEREGGRSSRERW